MLIELLILLIGIISGLLIWNKWHYSYWKRHNVRYLEPWPLVGNFKQTLKLQKSFREEFMDLHNSPELDDEPFVGLYFFNRRILLIRNLDLMKQILIKDFDKFPERVMQPDTKHDTFASKFLVFAPAVEWRAMKTRLSSFFTSSKIRQMHGLMQEISKDLEQFLAAQPDGSTVDIKSVVSRFTTDVMASITMGVRANSLMNAQSEIYQYNKKIFESNLKRFFDSFILAAFPSLAPWFGIKIMSPETNQYFSKLMAQMLLEREQSGTFRNDFIDHLIMIKEKAKDQPLDCANNFDFLVAQAMNIMGAGVDPSAVTLAFCLYELAKAPSVQNRLRAEIQQAFQAAQAEQLSYEQLQEMSLLSQVIDETLRLYPVGAIVERKFVPTANEQQYSLAPFSNFKIKKGMSIYISQLAVHKDEKYWPNALQFDPDRFAPENRGNINWNAYMPFGIGPRNCIGLRLALITMKMGLVYILKNHEVMPCEQTPKEIVFERNGFILDSKHCILRLCKINA